MTIRITTWNVNGIRNPFGYQPWRDKRTFDAMFDILEADIVIMQELKIQRKDLRDEMVMVPGWDCYFSLPKHKKGYSGVGIYTRQSVCVPIHAEEGILGALSPPNSTIPYSDLPPEQHIGGYLSALQLVDVGVDPAALDAEGRSVVLEFPAFVLFGLYSPANSNGLRDDFRHGFLNALDMRVRNLIQGGKRVVVTGDLNVSREEIDTANAEDCMKKEGISHEEYISTPNRRIFNQLLEGGKVFGERDEGRENPVLYDICRGFHPNRKGMFTHWEQKINARPGNFGSRIDFILCSLDMKSWFCESDIQEGLMGSDHCPVFAVINDVVRIGNQESHIKDMLNAEGTFSQGQRLKEYSMKDVPAFSAKLMPEFHQRRSIKDMFGRKPSLTPAMSTADEQEDIASQAPAACKLTTDTSLPDTRATSTPAQVSSIANATSSALSPSNSGKSPERKRPAPASKPSTARNSKKQKSTMPSPVPAPSSKAQQSLKGFFSSKTSPTTANGHADTHDTPVNADSVLSTGGLPLSSTRDATQATGDKGMEEAQDAAKVPSTPEDVVFPPHSTGSSTKSKAPDQQVVLISNHSPTSQTTASRDEEAFIDPVASMESWSKLFTKPVAPRCEHEEPCKMMKTKKTGFNCGRDFFMCARPLGPSGAKEKNTQWRCSTFIWSSNWNSGAERES